MQELTPVAGLAETEDEFLRPTNDTYNSLYIFTKDRKMYRRTRLQTGGTVIIPVTAIPNYTPPPPPEPTIRPSVDFLPRGEKMPALMLNQIISFFKSLMGQSVGFASSYYSIGNNQEAMVHIVWHPDTGYRVSVPKQDVGPASVRYTPDSYSREAGDVVVFDIHSHNVMGAFFSGTDNNDDRSKIYYSAVAGCLNHAEPKVICRFNFLETKFENIKLEDLFEGELNFKDTIDFPKEWLEKVTITQTYRTNSQPYGHRGYSGYGSFGGISDDEYNFGLAGAGGDSKNSAGLHGRRPARNQGLGRGRSGLFRDDDVGFYQGSDFGSSRRHTSHEGAGSGSKSTSHHSRVGDNHGSRVHQLATCPPDPDRPFGHVEYVNGVAYDTIGRAFVVNPHAGATGPRLLRAADKDIPILDDGTSCEEADPVGGVCQGGDVASAVTRDGWYTCNMGCQSAVYTESVAASRGFTCRNCASGKLVLESEVKRYTCTANCHLEQPVKVPYRYSGDYAEKHDFICPSCKIGVLALEDQQVEVPYADGDGNVIEMRISQELSSDTQDDDDAVEGPTPEELNDTKLQIQLLLNGFDSSEVSEVIGDVLAEYSPTETVVVDVLSGICDLSLRTPLGCVNMLHSLAESHLDYDENAFLTPAGVNSKSTTEMVLGYIDKDISAREDDLSAIAMRALERLKELRSKRAKPRIRLNTQ